MKTLNTLAAIGVMTIVYITIKATTKVCEVVFDVPNKTKKS